MPRDMLGVFVEGGTDSWSLSDCMKQNSLLSLMALDCLYDQEIKFYDSWAIIHLEACYGSWLAPTRTSTVIGLAWPCARSYDTGMGNRQNLLPGEWGEKRQVGMINELGNN